VGDIEFHDDMTIKRFVEDPANGVLRLWTKLDEANNLPKATYGIGADISLGTGASNSALSIMDLKLGEKVGELITPFMPPEQLAWVAVCMCKWLVDEENHGAMLIWEGNGPGASFKRAVDRLGYAKVFFRTDESKRPPRRSDTPGWFSKGESKRILFSDYRAALNLHAFINKSERAMDETKYYIHTANGAIEHIKAADVEDPGGARDNHGDIVIADALVAKLVYERYNKRIRLDRTGHRKAPVGSMAWRRQQREEKKRAQKSW